MIIHIHPDNPQQRNIDTVVDTLRQGGVIIYPTDTIYGIGCDITNPKAIERVCRIKGIAPKHAQFSFICSDLSHLSDYTKSINTPIFRLLKNALPGAYTFILNASKQVPKLLQSKKSTVGIRVPDNNICQMIIKGLGNPIISTSLPIDDDVSYYTDPEAMHERFEHLVDIVIDAGAGSMLSSTVIDCTSGEAVLIREGAGSWEDISG